MKLYYSKNVSNFGDVLNPLLFERIFNEKIKYTELKWAEAIGIGSILNLVLFNKNYLQGIISRKIFGELKVYGSGFIGPVGLWNLKEKFKRRMNFIGVRGKLTLERIRAIEGKDFNDVCLGDPALLTSLYFPPSKEKKYKFGIIPHFFDAENIIILKLAEKLKNSKIINVLLPPEQVIKEITSCEIIISTAMHGLIVSDSYNIPNIGAVVSDKVIGGDYKFRDYYSVFGEVPNLINLNENLSEKYFEELAANYRSKPVEQVQKNILNRFLN